MKLRYGAALLLCAVLGWRVPAALGLDKYYHNRQQDAFNDGLRV